MPVVQLVKYECIHHWCNWRLGSYDQTVLELVLAGSMRWCMACFAAQEQGLYKMTEIVAPIVDLWLAYPFSWVSKSWNGYISNDFSCLQSIKKKWNYLRFFYYPININTSFSHFTRINIKKNLIHVLIISSKNNWWSLKVSQLFYVI